MYCYKRDYSIVTTDIYDVSLLNSLEEYQLAVQCILDTRVTPKWTVSLDLWNDHRDPDVKIQIASEEYDTIDFPTEESLILEIEELILNYLERGILRLNILLDTLDNN